MGARHFGGFEEFCDEVALRVPDQFVGRATLNDGALFEHDNVPAERQDVPDVVTDDQGGSRFVPEVVRQEATHDSPGPRIEGREGFIEKEALGFGYDGPSERHPLAFSSRKLRGKPLGQVTGTKVVEGAKGLIARRPVLL